MTDLMQDTLSTFNLMKTLSQPDNIADGPLHNAVGDAGHTGRIKLIRVYLDLLCESDRQADKNEYLIEIARLAVNCLEPLK